MLIGWVDLIRQLFAKRRTEFVSADARGFSVSPKDYEMITSPASRPEHTPEVPGPAITSPPLTKDTEDSLSYLSESPRSRSGHYTGDYFNKDVEHNGIDNFGKEVEYRSPTLSFSIPRPRSSAGAMTRSGEFPTTLAQRGPASGRVFCPPREDSPTSFGRSSPARRGSGARSFTPTYEWDPASTYAKPSRRQEPYKY